MADPDTDEANGPFSDDDRIVRQAQKRFNRCEAWESTARARWLDDLKFCNADAYNLYQWPQGVLSNRGYGSGDERPNLTINKTRQHCLQVINDARQNKSSIKIIAVGNEASYESAQIMEGLVRHIEYISNAQSAYGTAIRYQVQAGLGYTRVVTDYAGPDTLDQEIFIRRVKDPLSIYLDPDSSEADASDARFGFVFDDMPKDVFEEKYPDFADVAGQSTLGNGMGGDGWITEGHVRVAEYYRKVEVRDKLVIIADPETGQELQVKFSEIPKHLRGNVVDDPARQREVSESKVEWFLIVGDKIAEKRDWPGKYIPIVPWPGETTIIDGQLDRKGHTRSLINPQQIYNYNASAAVEYGALQNKIPYIAPAEAIEGLETFWDTANTVNHSILPYNALREDGSTIPPPQRQAPPMSAPVFLSGMQAAAEDMRLVSGQYQADMGAPGNETSGVAIQQRQRQGDTATYHYIDHQAMAMRQLGKILVDLFPHIYETRRVMKILAEDGVQTEVIIDPKAQQAFAEQRARREEQIQQVLFNPSIGKYDVEVDIGPAYATRRQEQFAALSQIAAQNKEVMAIAGDLVFQAADFPNSDELAQRYRRTIPPNILGEEPGAETAQLQQQLQAMQQMLQAMAQKLAEKDGELAIKRDQKAIDAAKVGLAAYDSETKRLGALKDFLAADPEALRLLVRQEMQEAIASPDAYTVADAAAEASSARLTPPAPQPEPTGQGMPMGAPAPQAQPAPQGMPT